MTKRDPINEYGGSASRQPSNTSPLLPRQTLGPQVQKMADEILPAGLLMQYGGATAPDGWLLCDGRTLNRDLYQRLFAAIGTTYGAPDATTFKVPDMRGRMPVGRDLMQTEFDALGETGGAKENTHFHWQTVGADPGSIYIENDGAGSGHTRVITVYRTAGGFGAAATDGSREDGTYDTTIPTLPPYITINFIIRY
jgi:microcystin-dependent protein